MFDYLVNTLFDFQIFHAKPIGEDILLKDCADVINELFLSKSKVFEKIQKIMTTVFEKERRTTPIIQEKEKKCLKESQFIKAPLSAKDLEKRLNFTIKS